MLALLALVNLEGTVAQLDTLESGLLKVQLATEEGKRWVVLGPASWMAEKGLSLKVGDRVSVAAEGELATSVSVRQPDGSVFVLPLRGGEKLELKLWEANTEEKAGGGEKSNLK